MTPRRAFAAAAVVVTTTGTGAGYAYYRATVLDGGTATATVATTQPLTTVATTASGTPLHPGGTGDLVVRVTNPNAAAIRVESVGADGAVTGCATPDVTVTSPSAGLPFTLAAGETRTVTLTGAVAMGPGASTDCQAKTLTVPILLNG